MKMGDIKHLPSDRREINRRPYRFIGSIPVIHGKIGSKNHKRFVEDQHTKGGKEWTSKN